MPLYQAIVLALVQAFTEFLPVSSTAHLTLFPWLLGWQDPGLAFDVALHAGTLVAVLLYFFKDWLTLALCGVGVKYPANATAEDVGQHKKLFWYMVIGTIPGGILGALFEHKIEEHFRTPYVIAISLIAVALVMWWADSKSPLKRPIEQSNIGDAVTIGTAQALALLPRSFAFGYHDYRRALSRLHARSRNKVFLPSFHAANCGSSGLALAEADQAAQSRWPGFAAFHATHQHPGFRRSRIFRNRVFSALPANTHAQTICFLQTVVWYHRACFSVSPGGRAIAPTCPSHHSAFPKMLRRTPCVC